MKKSIFRITILVSFIIAEIAMAQEVTPISSASPTSTPAQSTELKPVTTPNASSQASPSPSPESAPPKNPEETSDKDILLEPTTTSLGEPTTTPAEDALPSETAPDNLPDPDTLIPSDIPIDEPPPEETQIKENKFQQEQKLKVRYQEVKLQALKDASVRNLRDLAERAKTDEAQRQALREYYRLLFAKMVAIDSSLQEKCNEMQEAYLRRLGQYQVAPTIPLNPPPIPEPLEMANTSPTPKSKHPAKSRTNN